MKLKEYLTCSSLYCGNVKDSYILEKIKKLFKTICVMIGKKADTLLNFKVVAAKWPLTTHCVLIVHCYKGGIENVSNMFYSILWKRLSLIFV